MLAYPLIDIQVGRIIGKGGQNVREMQRLTGAVIKLPEQVWCKEKKKLKEIHRQRELERKRERVSGKIEGERKSVYLCVCVCV